MLNKYVKAIAMTVLAVSSIGSANAQSVKGTIAIPGQPAQLAVDAVLNRVYVAVPNFGALPYDYLTVIDGNTDKVIKTIQIPPVAAAVAVDPFKSLVYVGGTYQDSNGNTQSQVAVINALTEQVITTISVSTTPGDGILGMAVNALNGTLYVTNGSDNEVDVIRNFGVRDRIEASAEPYGVAVNPFLNDIYVALLDGNVSVISGKTNAVTATTPFGASDIGVASDIVTGKVFATNFVGFPGSGTVGVFDQAANVLATVPVGRLPFGIDVDFGTHLVFVANTQDNSVSVINGSTNAVASTLPVSARFVAVNPVTEKVYAAAANNAAIVTVINEK
jgi:YVTN family beta-propeller protein